MRNLWSKNRHWMGATLLIAGSGMALIHYVDYGYLAHFPVEGLVIDHGVVGILLVIIGGIFAAGKPGASRRPPPPS